MATISYFYGIYILMYFRDHNPPHFHVKYEDYKAMIAISDFAILKGSLPPKAFGMVMEWAMLHKEELEEDWQLMATKDTFNKIAPLQ